MCNARPPLVRDNKGEHSKTSRRRILKRPRWQEARIIPWNSDEREKGGMQIGEEEWIPKPRYYSSGYYQYNCNNLRELQELKFENCLLKWGSKWSKKPPLSERGEVRKFRLIGLRPGLVRAVSGIIVFMSRYHHHHPNNIVVTRITDHTNNKLFSCGKNSWPQMIFNRCIINDISFVETCQFQNIRFHKILG